MKTKACRILSLLFIANLLLAFYGCDGDDSSSYVHVRDCYEKAEDRNGPEGDAPDSGEIGGEVGDGADTSPIPFADCRLLDRYGNPILCLNGNGKIREIHAKESSAQREKSSYSVTFPRKRSLNPV